MSLQHAWYKGRAWVWVLLPFTMLFYALSHLRRLLFKLHVLPSYKSSLKVVIVGNISVGGNGKTPTVIALAEHLLSKGVSCAVLLRGYGGTQTQFPYLLQALVTTPSTVFAACCLYRRTPPSLMPEPFLTMKQLY